jgi:hypothetical protein
MRPHAVTHRRASDAFAPVRPHAPLRAFPTRACIGPRVPRAGCPGRLPPPPMDETTADARSRARERGVFAGAQRQPPGRRVGDI